MSKPKSKISKLPAEVRDTLDVWLIDEGMFYKDARVKLESDFGFKISNRALCEYYTEKTLVPRNQAASDLADSVLALAKGSPEKFNDAKLKIIHERAFNLAVVEDGKLKDLEILETILGNAEDRKRKRDELNLSLERFRQQVKTDVEKGLDALFAEIKGRPEAEALFARLKDSVLKSVGGEA